MFHLSEQLIARLETLWLKMQEVGKKNHPSIDQVELNEACVTSLEQAMEAYHKAHQCPPCLAEAVQETAALEKDPPAPLKLCGQLFHSSHKGRPWINCERPAGHNGLHYHKFMLSDELMVDIGTGLPEVVRVCGQKFTCVNGNEHQCVLFAGHGGPHRRNRLVMENQSGK